MFKQHFEARSAQGLTPFRKNHAHAVTTNDLVPGTGLFLLLVDVQNPLQILLSTDQPLGCPIEGHARDLFFLGPLQFPEARDLFRGLGEGDFRGAQSLIPSFLGQPLPNSCKIQAHMGVVHRALGGLGLVMQPAQLVGLGVLFGGATVLIARTIVGLRVSTIVGLNRGHTGG